MINYCINKNVVIEKIDSEYLLLLDNSIFQINEYGYYIMQTICNKNIEEVINIEIFNNKNIDEKTIRDKINNFIDVLFQKKILCINKLGGSYE